MCQDRVCLCARVPRRRQTLAALSEMTGPSPLPVLVSQEERKKEGETDRWREREREDEGKGKEDTVVLTNCLYNSKHMTCVPILLIYTIITYLHRPTACIAAQLSCTACIACKNSLDNLKQQRFLK